MHVAADDRDGDVVVSGNGNVDAPGVICTADCSWTVSRGTLVNLTARWDPTSDYFERWEGISCPSTSCALSATGSITIRAVFGRDPLRACDGLGDESPCMTPCGQGVCNKGVCQGPIVKQAWSFATLQTTNVFFAGIADADGNVYWTESDALNCSLVSAAPDGSIRFRVPCGSDNSGYLALDGDLMLSSSYERLSKLRAWNRTEST